MASDHGADFHYVQQAEDGSAAGASSTPAARALSACSYCRGLLDKQAAAYCAACFSTNGKCRALCKEEPAPLAPQSDAPLPATAAKPQQVDTQLQQALAALRETRGHAALNIQQTRLAFDVTRAASESGTMNVKKFKKQA